MTCGVGIGWGDPPDGPRDVPWLNEVQRPPHRDDAKVTRLSPLLKDDDGHAITTRDEWSRRRSDLRRQWLEFLGPLATKPRERPKIDVLEEDQVDGVLRQRVRYEPEVGLSTEAYLLKPAGAGSRRPGVVVFHSTVDHSIRQPAGIEGRAEVAFGLNLARRGYVAFCPRNFLWPTNSTIDADTRTAEFLRRHPDSKGMAKMLLDAMVAVDILSGVPEVDPSCLGAVGHSLGAKEVLYLAALDERIRVVVSSEGGIGTRFSNWDAPWYLSAAIKSPDFGHEHHELLALVAPRPFLLIGGDSADGDRSWPFIASALEVYRLYGTPPRLGLFNHGKGHTVPPEAERRIYEWFDTYLR